MGTGRRNSTLAPALGEDVAIACPLKLQDDDADVRQVDVDVGVAVETRNYMALVRNTRNEDAQRKSEPVIPNRRSGIVEGLPLQTGNYAALLSASVGPKRTALPCVVEAEVAAPPAASADPEMGQAVDDTNTSGAVLGLPISSGNYEAMFVEDADRKIRQRGYSELAKDRARGRLRSSVSSNKSHSHSHSHSNSRSGPSKKSMTKRESCFEGRRSGTVAVPLRKGWLFIQSPTRKMWKRYFAVLSGFEFRYCKEPAQAPVGFAQVQAVNAWNGKPHGLVFVSTTGAPIHAYCDNDTDRDTWVQFMTQVLEKRHNITGQSKTAYTVTTADQHDGYMFLRERSREWCRYFFSMRNDGYLSCRVNERGSNDSRYSGYVQSVGFAEVHPHGLAIQLDSGVSLLVHTETYDEQMMWLAVISSAANVNDTRVPPASAIKTTYVDTARPNHAGWLYKQHGIFKTWKHVYVTLHGAEIGYAKDTNAPLDEVDCIHSVKEWDGHEHGLQIWLASGQVWRVRAESYEGAKQWRNIINDRIRHADRLDVHRYLNSCKRHRTEPIFGGWLTTTQEGVRLRQFYVMDGNMLGVADDVDNLLRPIGSIVDITAIRTVANGMQFMLGDGSELKVSGDSVDAAKAWYDCLNACL